MQKHIKRISILVIAVITTITALNINNFAAATVPGTNQLVSYNSTGGFANGGSGPVFISPNGKVAIFTSTATNILPSGGGGIFARNLSTGVVSRVNVSTAGVIGNSGNTLALNVSATGRYVLFYSLSTNLIDGTTISGTKPQLYLRDTVASTTTLISQNLSGTIADGTYLDGLGVSSDGRFIAFASNATNLSPESTTGTAHLYMLDRVNNTINIMDRKSDGTVDNTTNTFGAQGSMSCDGSILAFQYGKNLIVGDTDSNHVDVYILDLRGGGAKLTNLTKTANAAGLAPKISCNGDFVGFKSAATNIDASISFSNTGYNHPYVYDRGNGVSRIVSLTTSNAVVDTVDNCAAVWTGNTAPCVQVSDTGLGVFSANDPTLTGASGDQVYQRNMYTGTTELVSKSSSGTVGNSGSSGATISADGRVVLYGSGATNLVSGDTNGYSDVFTSLTGY